MNTVSKWISIALSAGGYFYLCYVMIATWLDPMSIQDGRWVKYGVGLFVLEFVMMHSGVFMSGLAGGLKKDWKVAFGGFAFFFVIYGLFAACFALVFQSPGLLLVYTMIMLGRFMAVFSTSDNSAITMGRSALSAILYFIIMFASALIPVPEAGVTPEVLEQVYPNRGSGIWEQDPQRVLVWASIYFGLIGLAEIFLFSWAKPGGPVTMKD